MHNHEILGLGGERVVRPDPVHPDTWVRKEKRDGQEQPLREVKAGFYLTKILHLLHPENVPDVHQASGHVLVAERKDLGPDHALLNEEVRRYEEGEDVPEDFRKQTALAKQRLLQDSRVREVIRMFEQCGVSIDDAAVNFGMDQNGNAIYVDAFEPWREQKGNSLKPGYDTQALRQAIMAIEDDVKQKSGLHWLDRLDHLFAEEEHERREGRLDA